MVYCVQALLIFANASVRNTRLTQAQDFLTGKPQWSVTTLVPTVTLGDHQPALSLTARFTSKSGQDSVNVALKGQAGIQSGSWVQIHDCPHDQGANTCAATVNRTTF